LQGSGGGAVVLVNGKVLGGGAGTFAQRRQRGMRRNQ
jgi:hypothetical protein